MEVTTNKIKKNWFKLDDKYRFCIIGIFNACVAYLIYSVSLLILNDKYYQISLALAWIISSITSFLMHRFFVFYSKGNLIKEYIKCSSTWIVAYLINAILLEIFVRALNINAFLAQLLAPAIASIFTYFMFKKKVFKR